MKKGLRIIDITSLTNPVIVGYVDMNGYADGIYATGNYVFVGNEGSGIRILMRWSTLLDRFLFKVKCIC